MTNTEWRFIGISTCLICIAMTAPIETQIILKALSKTTPNISPKSIPLPATIKDDVGIIRQCKRKIIASAKQFWRWLY